MTREDYRTLVKSKIANLSTNLSDIFSDEEINNAFLHTLQSLPYKNLPKEKKSTTTLVLNKSEYSVPSGAMQIVKIERNDGSTAIPNWIELKGWKVFAREIHLRSLPSTTNTIRTWYLKRWGEPADDNDTIDSELDSKQEVIVTGIVKRLMETLMNYLIDASNYDSTIKPTGATLPQVRQWYEQMRLTEETLINSFKTTRQPDKINMVD